jgi:hypothetical protein
MDYKQEFEERLKRLEDLIEEKGVGARPLNKVKKVQRNLNVGIAVGSLLTVAGLTVWLLNK